MNQQQKVSKFSLTENFNEKNSEYLDDNNEKVDNLYSKSEIHSDYNTSKPLNKASNIDETDLTKITNLTNQLPNINHSLSTETVNNNDTYLNCSQTTLLDSNEYRIFNGQIYKKFQVMNASFNIQIDTN